MKTILSLLFLCAMVTAASTNASAQSPIKPKALDTKMVAPKAIKAKTTLKAKKAETVKPKIAKTKEKNTSVSRFVQFQIEIISAQIKKKKVSGNNWDFGFGAKPDPYCLVKIGPMVVKTRRKSNTFLPSWNLKSQVFQLPADTKVQITLTDKDLRNDDLIGESKGKLTIESLLANKKGLYRFGQVEELWIKATLIKQKKKIIKKATWGETATNKILIPVMMFAFATLCFVLLIRIFRSS